MINIEIDGAHNFLRTVSPDNGEQGEIMENSVRHATQARAISARNRTGGYGEPSGVLHVPQVPHPKRFTLWDLILKGESVMTSQTTEGQPAVVKVPHSLLGIMLALVLALVSGGVWLVSSVTGISKDIGYVKDDTKVLMRMIETNNAYISAETNRVNFMVGLLSKDKRQELYEYDRNNPMPPRIVEVPEALKDPQ